MFLCQSCTDRNYDATIILNVVFKAYSVTQFEALIIPVLFMLFTILNGRKNL